MLERRAAPADPAWSGSRPVGAAAGWLPDPPPSEQGPAGRRPGQDAGTPEAGPAPGDVDGSAGAVDPSFSTGSGGMALTGVLASLRHRLPPVVRGGRVALSARAARALVVVALLALVLAGAVAWRARAQVRSAYGDAASTGSSAPSDSTGDAPAAPPTTAAPAASPSATSIVVDVAGKVVRPGVVTLPSGSRVVEALRRAGGALPGVDLSSVDLARVLVDGEQVLVGVPGAGVLAPTPAPATGSSVRAGVEPSAPVSLNGATAEQLDALPGVGPVLAQRIVTWREAHGGFTSVSQLQEIPGLGGKKFAILSPLVRL